jgi:hypothetical protein
MSKNPRAAEKILQMVVQEKLRKDTDGSKSNETR